MTGERSTDSAVRRTKDGLASRATSDIANCRSGAEEVAEEEGSTCDSAMGMIKDGLASRVMPDIADWRSGAKEEGRTCDSEA